MIGKLDDAGARLMSRAGVAGLEQAYRDGIAVWCALARRDDEDLDVYAVEGGVIVVAPDGGELHLGLVVDRRGNELAVAHWIEELSW